MNLADAADLTLRHARAKAGVEAEVVAAEGERLEVGVRLGKTEKLKRSRERRVALRVFTGRSSAVVSTSDLTADSIERLVVDGSALAAATASDPFSGLPDLSGESPLGADLDLFDPLAETFGAEEAIDVVRTAEDAALRADPRITNSEGAEMSASTRHLLYATSSGFRGEQRGSSFSLSVVPIASANGSMQRDYWYAAARHRADLADPLDVGRIAAERTLRRLGARSVATCEVPVVFDPETAASLLAHLASAAAGSAIYRGMSFLRDRLGERIAPPNVRIVDDPLRRAGLASRPFDAEGLTSRRNVVLDAGILTTFLLDTYSARKLAKASTASAARALGEPPAPGPTNFHLEPGRASAAEIIGSVRKGLYVTELIGSGVNPVTGDYSRGAAGVWIENGELTFPVEEITIAGNLLAMFAGIEAIGDDLAFRSAISSPTVMIGNMTVAGHG
jgi:PmbA protein